MLATILKWLGGGVISQFTGPLLDAYKAKLAAQNDADRLAAEQTITRIEAARDIAVTEAGRAWSATSVGRWLIVVPFGLWWAALWLIQIINPWFGLSLVVVAVPAEIMDMAKILVPAIVIADAGALAARRIGK
jgi:hypothetical protein